MMKKATLERYLFMSEDWKKAHAYWVIPMRSGRLQMTKRFAGHYHLQHVGIDTARTG